MVQSGYPTLDRRRIQTPHTQRRRITGWLGSRLPRRPSPQRHRLASPAITHLSMPSLDLTAARTRIAAAYNPAALETAGTQLMGTVAEHFRRVESRDSKVLNWNEPNTLIREARNFLAHSPLPFRDGMGEGSTNSQRTSPKEIAGRISNLARQCFARG